MLGKFGVFLFFFRDPGNQLSFRTLSLRKQTTFRDAITGFSAKCRWEASAEIPDWWLVTTLIWPVLLIGWGKFSSWHDQSEALPRTRWRYGISALVSQTSFGGVTSGDVAKCRLFSHADLLNVNKPYLFWLFFQFRKNLEENNCVVKHPVTGAQIDFHKLASSSGR